MTATPRAPRERMLHALDRKPPVPGERAPHFELEFFLTMEAFGIVHPSQRRYGQWRQMEGKERERHRRDLADLHVRVMRRFTLDGFLLHPNPGTDDEVSRLVDLIRERVGGERALFLHGDATYAIPNGEQMVDFAVRMAEEPGAMKAEADRAIDAALARADRFARHGGIDGFALCADYAFNNGPFMSPGQFGEFVTPYLARLTRGYRDRGFYVIKHTDGDIRPILDQIAQTEPHALHSIDPQGHMDIAEVKARYGDRLALIGNVNCALIDTGTEAEMLDSARYALRHGMPGGGYVFGTSNCIYTGMKLARYEMLLDLLNREGVYPA